MAISGPQKWLDEHYNAFVTKFKKVSRQQLPFERCGATYERIPGGYRMVQSEFCGKVKPVKIAEGRKDDDKLNSEEVTSYRSILGALLWLTTSGIPHHRCRDQTSSTSQSSFAASPKQGRQGSWRLFLQVAPRARSTFGMFPWLKLSHEGQGLCPWRCAHDVDGRPCGSATRWVRHRLWWWYDDEAWWQGSHFVEPWCKSKEIFLLNQKHLPQSLDTKLQFWWVFALARCCARPRNRVCSSLMRSKRQATLSCPWITMVIAMMFSNWWRRAGHFLKTKHSVFTIWVCASLGSLAESDGWFWYPLDRWQQMLWQSQCFHDSWWPSSLPAFCRSRKRTTPFADEETSGEVWDLGKDLEETDDRTLMKRFE